MSVKLPELAAATERLLGTRLTVAITLVALIGFAALAFGAQADTSRGPIYGLSLQAAPPRPDLTPVSPPQQHAHASLRGMQPGR